MRLSNIFWKVIILSSLHTLSLFSIQRSVTSLPKTGARILPLGGRSTRHITPARTISSSPQNNPADSNLQPATRQSQKERGSNNFKKYGYAAVAGTTALGGCLAYKYTKPDLEQKFEALNKQLAVKKFDLRGAINAVIAGPEEKIDDFLNEFTEFAKQNGFESKDFITILDYLNAYTPDKLHRIMKFDWYLKNADNASFQILFKKWLTENPRYLKTFLHSIIETISHSSDYLPRWLFSTTLKAYLDMTFSICEKMITNPAYKKEILDLFKTLNYEKLLNYEQRNYSSSPQDVKLQKAVSSIQLREYFIDKKKYPNLAKSLQESPEYNKKMFSLRRIYEKQRQEILLMKSRLKEHAKDSQAISSKHLSELIKEEPTLINKAANTKALNQFLSALDEALELNNRGYFTFFHGQSQGYALVNDITTMLLYQLAELPMPDDFYFLRIRREDLPSYSGDYWQNAIDTVKEHRFLMKSNNSGLGNDFMAFNLFAFGNYKLPASNTFDYVNKDASNSSFKKSTVFYDFLNNFLLLNTTAIEEKFNDILEKIQQTYPTGRLILVAIPSHTANEQVYTFNFPNRLNKDIGEYIEDLFSKKDLSFKTLDRIHCVMPLTPAGILNPYNDVKILRFDNPRSPQSEQDTQAAKKELVNDIIKALNQEGQLERAQDHAKAFFRHLKEVHEIKS